MFFHNAIKQSSDFSQDKDFTCGGYEESNRKFTTGEGTYYIDISPSGPHLNIRDGHMRDCDAISDIKVHDSNNSCKRVYQIIGEISHDFEKQDDYWVLPCSPLYVVAMPFQMEKIIIEKKDYDEKITVMWKSIRFDCKVRTKYASGKFITKDEKFTRLYMNGFCGTYDNRNECELKLNKCYDDLPNGLTWIEER